MLNIGPQELLIILVIALLVVGPQRLPALGRSIGRGLRELRKAQDEVKRTIQVNLDDEGSNRRTSPSPRRSAPATPAATTPTAGAETPPSAGEPLPAEDVREISRSLGRSLAKLRRAREEVERSFRVDPDQRPAPPARPSSAARPPAEPPRPTGTASEERQQQPAPEPPAGE